MRILIATLIAATLWSQTGDFKAQSRLVIVPATVLDGRGRAVEGLQGADFEVLDNGLPQSVSVDTTATGVAPIALVVAVQCSGISAPVLAKVQKIGVMIQPLITGERGSAAVVAFDDRVQWIQEFTPDPELLDRAFQRLRPGEQKQARMLDALSAAIHRLRGRDNVRRVILLISETRDRGSESTLEQVVMAAQSAGVAIYAATYSATATAFTTKPGDMAPPSTPKGPPLPSREPESPAGREHIPIPSPDYRLDIIGGIGELMRLGKTKSTAVLTEATGGSSLSFTRQKGLEKAIEKLGSELHTQYVLSFTPDRTIPGYHSIQVKVRGRSGLRVRARPGYWGVSQPRAAFPRSCSPGRYRNCRTDL